jgi:imidazolonepropionase-like amidohydrolase
MARIFFRGANLIDGINAPQPNATVVVEGERIVTVATNGNSPQPTPQDTVVDLYDKTLMPGMVMCHFHSAYDNISSLDDIDLKHPSTYLTLVAAKNAEDLLLCGYTGAVGAGTVHNIDVTLKKAINAGLIRGPRIMACGRDVVTTGDSVDAHPGFWKIGMEGLAAICDGPAEFRKAVREEVKKGVDIIKLYPTGGHGLPWPADVMTMSYDEMEAAAQAAHERGRKIRGHIVSKKGILAAVEAGIDVIDHGDLMDDVCIEAMAKAGSVVVPSLYFPFKVIEDHRKTGDAGAAYFVEKMQQGLEIASRTLPKAQAAGVKFVVGDDFGAAPLLHGEYARELEAYVRVGISPLDVITWATRNGADLMGMKDDLGTIEAGKLADLLVVEGNPAQDITVLQEKGRLCAIMKGGQFVECKLTPTPVQESQAAA